MKFDFSFIRKSVQSLSSQVTDLRAQIAKLTAERAAILAAPASREDVKAMVTSWAKDRASEYITSLQMNMAFFVKYADKLADPATVRQRMTVFGASQQLGSGFESGPSLNDKAVCALFGAALIDGVHAAIDRMQWPDGALPLEGRQKRVQEIDRALSTLVAEEAEIVSSARSAGVLFE